MYDWVASGSSRQAAMLDKGIALAAARRTALKELIRQNPKEALRRAISYRVRRLLPAEVESLLEEPVHAAGRYEVMVMCGLPERSNGGLSRFFDDGNRRFAVHTYGRRLDVTSKFKLSAIGIAVDDQLALSDEPVRVIPADEAVIRGLEPGKVWVESMGEVLAFENAGAVEKWAAALRAAEDDIDPAAQPDPSGGGGGSGSGQPGASSYTTGSKTMLFIVCDYPNATGFPDSISAVSNAMVNVAEYMKDASFGRLMLTITVVPEIVRLPQNGQYYTNRFIELLDDARRAARQAGYDANNYDFYGVLSAEHSTSNNRIDFPYAGIAWIGMPGFHVVHPHYTLRTTGHEFAHNLGLFHANYWRTDCDTPIGRDSAPGGYVGDEVNAEWTEYAHRFSLMSSQISPDMNDRTAHFAAGEKHRLSWIGTNQIAWVTNSGLIRIYRHDHRSATQGPFAACIQRPSSDYTGNQRQYWLTYRMAYTTNEWLRHGVQIDWQKPNYGQDGVILLDMTPYSNDSQGFPAFLADNLDKWDAALLLGRTFSDEAAGIHITPVARGGATPSEWIEVYVHLDSGETNRPPQLLLTASATNGAVNAEFVFTATASDPDGDSLAYAWDFGLHSQIFTQTLNQSTVTHRWTEAGEYLVRCTASDRKGGRASAAIAVRVGNVNRFRLAGRVLANGSPMEGARVSISPAVWTRTLSDGSFQLLNLQAGIYTVRTQCAGAKFEPAFDNPVAIGPSRESLDFGLSGPPGIALESTDMHVLEGRTLAYTLRLRSRPSTQVVVRISERSFLTNLTATVTFTPYNWVVGATVSAQVVDNRLPGPPFQTAVVAHVAIEGDPNYIGLTAELRVRIEEDEAWDTDIDGLPDDFESAYFGNPVIAVPTDDNDGDGLNNLDEYIAGSIPIDGASYPRTQMDPEMPLWIGIPTVTGRVYSLFATEALTDNGGWHPVPHAQDLPGNGSIIWIQVPHSVGSFFRYTTRLAP